VGYDDDEYEFYENVSHDEELEDSFEEGVLFFHLPLFCLDLFRVSFNYILRSFSGKSR